ncbi:MAG: thioesterase family protein [Bacteroidales bacterium]|jgi:predicted thioesterase|nr:thioesterase family protein [Bacteroidales bacterium]MDD4385059.1 thioesterase family protein [Bacteroidales bacterium]MDY0196294.1 thioesterase family protein [Tenuifilaceae bacterium]
MKVGDSFISNQMVTHSTTANHLGSGDLAVFATPSMIALMENASMMAVKQSLPKGQTTVGSAISIKHTRPTPLNATVSAKAVLKSIEGKKLTFAVNAWDSNGDIGIGEHVRYIVDIKTFMASLT